MPSIRGDSGYEGKREMIQGAGIDNRQSHSPVCYYPYSFIGLHLELSDTQDGEEGKPVTYRAKPGGTNFGWGVCILGSLVQISVPKWSWHCFIRRSNSCCNGSRAR